MPALKFDEWLMIMPDWFENMPDFLEWIQRIVFEIFRTFVFDNRWILFVKGLITTFIVTIGALIIGVIIGMLVALVRSTHDSSRGKPNIILAFLNMLCKVYVTVLRGTPLMVQLLIMGFVVMLPGKEAIFQGVADFFALEKGTFIHTVVTFITEEHICAIITLGINSGAYVAEIARSGIMSIPAGQMEAGRSLGLNFVQTMAFIILPQAFKNILPALGNELIALLKETSLVATIALADVTKAAQIVQANTYSAIGPYISLAVIYLVIVMILTKLLGMLERRLRTGDKR